MTTSVDHMRATRLLNLRLDGIRKASGAVATEIFSYNVQILLDYISRPCYIDSHPRSLRGVSGDDPEGGAGSGVLRRRLVTARLGRQGPRPPGTTTWVRGARCTDPEAPARRCRTAGAEGAGSAAPGAQNRHGGAPRGERPASWDARRLARRLACRVMCRPNGCSAEHPNVSRRSAHPSIRVGEAKLQTPGRKNAPRERRGVVR